MIKIKCPKCGEEIELGKDAYTSLLNDVKKDEVDRQVSTQLKVFEEAYKQKLESEKLNAQIKQTEKINELSTKLAVLEEKLKNSDKDKQIAVSDALSEKEKEVIKLQGEILQKKKEFDSKEESLRMTIRFAQNDNKVRSE